MARPRKAQELDIGRRAVEETIRLIAQRGDFDVPLTEVAQAIGCTAPALYGHFRNKCALLVAMRDEGFNRLYEVKAAVSERMRSDPSAICARAATPMRASPSTIRPFTG